MVDTFCYDVFKIQFKHSCHLLLHCWKAARKGLHCARRGSSSILDARKSTTASVNSGPVRVASTWINISIQIGIFDHLTEAPGFCSSGTDVFPQTLRRSFPAFPRLLSCRVLKEWSLSKATWVIRKTIFSLIWTFPSIRQRKFGLEASCLYKDFSTLFSTSNCPLLFKHEDYKVVIHDQDISPASWVKIVSSHILNIFQTPELNTMH